MSLSSWGKFFTLNNIGITDKETSWNNELSKNGEILNDIQDVSLVKETFIKTAIDGVNSTFNTPLITFENITVMRTITRQLLGDDDVNDTVMLAGWKDVNTYESWILFINKDGTYNFYDEIIYKNPFDTTRTSDGIPVPRMFDIKQSQENGNIYGIFLSYSDNDGNYGINDPIIDVREFITLSSPNGTRKGYLYMIELNNPLNHTPNQETTPFEVVKVCELFNTDTNTYELNSGVHRISQVEESEDEYMILLTPKVTLKRYENFQLWPLKSSFQPKESELGYEAEENSLSRGRRLGVHLTIPESIAEYYGLLGVNHPLPTLDLKAFSIGETVDSIIWFGSLVKNKEFNKFEWGTQPIDNYFKMFMKNAIGGNVKDRSSSWVNRYDLIYKNLNGNYLNRYLIFRSETFTRNVALEHNLVFSNTHEYDHFLRYETVTNPGSTSTTRREVTEKRTGTQLDFINHYGWKHQMFFDIDLEGLTNQEDRDTESGIQFRFGLVSHIDDYEYGNSEITLWGLDKNDFDVTGEDNSYSGDRNREGLLEIPFSDKGKGKIKKRIQTFLNPNEIKASVTVNGEVYNVNDSLWGIYEYKNDGTIDVEIYLEFTVDGFSSYTVKRDSSGVLLSRDYTSNYGFVLDDKDSYYHVELRGVEWLGNNRDNDWVYSTTKEDAESSSQDVPTTTLIKKVTYPDVMFEPDVIDNKQVKLVSIEGESLKHEIYFFYRATGAVTINSQWTKIYEATTPNFGSVTNAKKLSSNNFTFSFLTQREGVFKISHVYTFYDINPGSGNSVDITTNTVLNKDILDGERLIYGTELSLDDVSGRVSLDEELNTYIYSISFNKQKSYSFTKTFINSVSPIRYLVENNWYNQGGAIVTSKDEKGFNTNFQIDKLMFGENNLDNLYLKNEAGFTLYESNVGSTKESYNDFRINYSFSYDIQDKGPLTWLLSKELLISELSMFEINNHIWACNEGILEVEYVNGELIFTNNHPFNDGDLVKITLNGKDVLSFEFKDEFKFKIYWLEV